MGHKINPIFFRLGKTKPHSSVCFTRRLRDYVRDDRIILDYIKAKFGTRDIAKVVVERINEHFTITIRTSKPGLVIGKNGSLINQANEYLSKSISVYEQKGIKKNAEVFIKVEEVKRPETDPALIAANIVQCLKDRIPHRRVAKKAIAEAMRGGLEGIHIEVAGRLGGNEIASRDKFSEGAVPRHTIRADIDYSFQEAKTTYGICSVKVWTYHGEVFGRKQRLEDEMSSSQSHNQNYGQAGVHGGNHYNANYNRNMDRSGATGSHYPRNHQQGMGSGSGQRPERRLDSVSVEPSNIGNNMNTERPRG